MFRTRAKMLCYQTAKLNLFYMSLYRRREKISIVFYRNITCDISGNIQTIKTLQIHAQRICPMVLHQVVNSPLFTILCTFELMVWDKRVKSPGGIPPPCGPVPAPVDPPA